MNKSEIDLMSEENPMISEPENGNELNKRVIKWSKPQKTAIEAENCSLVVSAAAGSGKTAVLTERIIQKLCAENDSERIDLSRTVVSTFTKAAAEGLRQKLYEKLNEMALKNPENREIANQLIKINDAKICTIDSFCNSVFSEYRSFIGIDEMLKIGDKSEIDPLKYESADECFERFGKNASEGFNKLYEVFAQTRTDKDFIEFILKLNEKLASFPDKEECIKQAIEKSEEELMLLEEGKIRFADTVFGKSIYSSIKDEISFFKEKIKYIIASIKNSELDAKYGDYFEKLLSYAEKWEKYCSENKIGEIIRECGEANAVKFPAVRNLPESLKVFKQYIHGIAKDGINNLSDFLEEKYDFTEEKAYVLYRESIDIEKAIYEIMHEFDSIFAEKKRKAGLAEYSDIEHFALDILTDKKGNKRIKSKIAERITKETDAVFVDEYQDTNELQDAIFRAISKPDNLFIVGDPKQSIYRFRGAEPEIFTDYKNRCPKYEKGSKVPSAILLSDNFRCDAPIIDFTNFIFKNVMGSNRADSLYKPEDMLIHSKENAFADGENKIEIDFYNERSETDEASVIARRIMSIISGEIKNDKGEKLGFSDIAVIARKNKPLIAIREKLMAKGIPCTDILDESLNVSEEYLFIDSLLAAISNPLDDIALCSAMHSPVFRFTDDDLFFIRQKKHKSAFYLALEKTAEANEPISGKLKKFLDSLSYLRNEMKNLSMSEGIFLIYRYLSVEEIYYSVSKDKKDTLALILSIAQKFDQSNSSGIDKFREYLASSISSDSFSDNDNAVKLTTIHKSKGLEYPVVFLASAQSEYNKSDSKSKWVFSKDKGVFTALPIFDAVILDSPMMKSITADTVFANKEEEKRVLYVAFTRAVKKLIITSSVSITKEKTSKELKKSFCFSEFPMSDDLRQMVISHAQSYLELIMAGIQGSFDFSELPYAGTHFENGMMSISNLSLDEKESAASLDEFIKKDKEILTQEFDADIIISGINTIYENDEKLLLPEKLSVSEILKADETRDEIKIGSLIDITSGGLNKTSAFIGTSMHKTMQFMDFENAERDIRKEAKRILDKKFITEDEYSVLDFDELAAFFNSEIWQEMKKSDRLVREKRFNVLFDADEFYDIKGEVLVQGVIDAYFENADGSITAVDFKTDRVKGGDAEKLLIERHSKQLKLYAKAIEKITEKKVNKCVIYSFALSKSIEI